MTEEHMPPGSKVSEYVTSASTSTCHQMSNERERLSKNSMYTLLKDTYMCGIKTTFEVASAKKLRVCCTSTIHGTLSILSQVWPSFSITCSS
jgi:hypothetical protein